MTLLEAWTGRCVIFVITISCTIACAGDAADTTGGVAVRDSAGIEIVESPAALADRSYDLRLGEPAADIGVVDGAPEYQLFRVTSIASLEDGRIVVVNGGTQELRFYDATGRFLFSRGGRGDGPGEYQFPLLIPSSFGDSLFVFDLQASRISVLNTDGELVRTVRPEGSVSEPIGVLRDGRLLIVNSTARAGMNTPEGLIENGRVLQVMMPGEAARDTIATHAGPTLFLWNRNSMIGFTSAPFDVGPSHAFGADRIFVTPGRIPEVHELDPGGRLIRIMRVDRELEELTRGRFDAYVEARVAEEEDPAEAAEVRRRYGQTPMRERLPAYRRLLVDGGGNVWAERYREDAASPATWTIFRATGEAAGSLRVPAGVRLLVITSSRAVGVVRDAMDVEHVVAWPLIPSVGESGTD